MKKKEGFIKRNKISLLVSAVLFLLLIGIPVAYVLGTNNADTKSSRIQNYDELRYTPMESMEQLQLRMDKLFEELSTDPFVSYSYDFPLMMNDNSFSSSTFDYEITKNSIIINAKLPIKNKDAVNVTIDKNGVSIKSVQQQILKKEKDNENIEEIKREEFYKYLALPENADIDKAVQTFNDGELKIEIPLK